MADRDTVPVPPSVFDTNRWIGRLSGRPAPDPALAFEAEEAWRANAALDGDLAPDPATVEAWEQAEFARLLRLREEAERAVTHAREALADARRRYAVLPRPERPGGAVTAGALGVLGVGVGLALAMKDLFGGTLPELQGLMVGAAVGALLAGLPVYGMLRAARHEHGGWGLGWLLAALTIATGMLFLRAHLNLAATHVGLPPEGIHVEPGAEATHVGPVWAWHAGGFGPLDWTALGFTVLELGTLICVHVYARGLSHRYAAWSIDHHAHTVARRRYDAAEEHLEACTANLAAAEARVEDWLAERRRRVDAADLAGRKGEAAARFAALGQRVGAEAARRELVGADTSFPSRADALTALLSDRADAGPTVGDRIRIA